jgi:hypothetical protein
MAPAFFLKRMTQENEQPNLLRRVKHGGRRGGSADLRRTYRSWRCMRERCLNPGHASFARYGLRGITICSRWLIGENGIHPFVLFCKDLGLRKVGMSLDRINVDLGYCPENCKWSDAKEQRHNQRKAGVVSVFSDVELAREILKRWHGPVTILKSSARGEQP